MQPAFAMQHDMETRLLMARRRCLPAPAILADMKQRAFEFQTGKQPVSNFFGVRGYEGHEGSAWFSGQSLYVPVLPEQRKELVVGTLFRFDVIGADQPRPAYPTGSPRLSIRRLAHAKMAME
jgi:hypothetical protein